MNQLCYQTALEFYLDVILCVHRSWDGFDKIFLLTLLLLFELRQIYCLLFFAARVIPVVSLFVSSTQLIFVLPVFDRLRSQSTAKIRVCTPTSCILSYQMKVNKLIRESAISARLLWDQPAWCLIGIREKTKTSTTSADAPNNYCLEKGGMLRSSALILFPGRRKSNPFWSLGLLGRSVRDRWGSFPARVD